MRQFALGHLRPVPHALAEVIERFGRLPERPVRKLHAGAVVREQAEVAESERIHVELHQIVDRHGVARRLGHLHAVGEEMLPMYPVPDRRVAVRALGLRDLVLVVRKDIVDATRMKIEAFAEVLGAHR